MSSAPLSLKYAHFTNQDSRNGVCIRAVPLYATVLPFQAGIMREQRLRQDLHRQMEETKEEMKARVRGRGGGGAAGCWWLTEYLFNFRLSHSRLTNGILPKHCEW